MTTTRHRSGWGNSFVPALLALGLLSARPALAQPQLDSALPVPRILVVTPQGGQAGTAVEVTFTGTDIEAPEKLLFSNPAIKGELIEAPKPPPPDPKKPPKKGRPGRNMGTPGVSKFKVTIPADLPVGTYDVRLVNKWGVSNPRAFVVGDQKEAIEKEPNNDVNEAQRVSLNTTVNGAIANPTDVDYYVFAGKKGQRVLLSCRTTSIDSRAHPAVELYDAKGKLLAGNRNYHHADALADCTLPDDGDYYVRLFEFTHTFPQQFAPLPPGTQDHFYRLSITTAPWIDAVYPCVVEAGKKTTVTVYGRNLPGGKPDPEATADDRVLEKITVDVTPPKGPEALHRLTFGGWLAPGSSALDGFEYRVRNAAGSSNLFLLTVTDTPVTLDRGGNDTAETAQELSVPCEVAGRVEKRRDRDWYAFTAKKGEVYTIDLQSERLGAPPAYVYFMLRNAATKQDIFESQEENPNAVSRKFYTFSEDPPAYRFTAPADGKYLLLVASRVGDTVAGPRQFYRLRVAPERPDFRLVAMAPDNGRPDAPTVLEGGNQSFTVFAARRDGFAGDIHLSIEGLPPGVTCAPQVMGGDVKQVELVFSAAASAAPWTGPVTVKGTATIRGQKVVREARSACILWPMPVQFNSPALSRLDHATFLAVRPGKAPYNLSLALDKDTLVQGDKGTLKLKLGRLWPDFKTPLTVQARQFELPRNLRINNNQPFNLAAGKNDGTLPIAVGADTPPGTYTIVLRTQAQIPYDKNPMGKQKKPTVVVQPSAPVTLTILPKALARLTLGNAGPNVKAGAQAEVVVRVDRLFNYDGEFKVEVVLPPNVKDLDVGPVVIPAGKNEAKLVIKVPAGTKPGNRGNLIVRATATVNGKVPIKHEAKFNVNVVK